MRSVFDNNVSISALLFPRGKPYSALEKALTEGRILISLPVYEELNVVSRRPKFFRYFSEAARQAFVDKMARDSEWVPVVATINVCRDPKDNMLLELAVSGEADYIITGDQDLLVLDPFRGIRIVTPDAFLAIP